MATATLGTFFQMARRIAAACATASTQPRCGLFIAMTWKRKAMALTLTKWRNSNDGTRSPGRWLLLGHARPYSTPRRRDIDAGGLYGWGRPERYLPQSRNSRRSYRDYFRSHQDQL